MPTIILAEDHELVRRALRGILGMEDGLMIVAETGDGLEAARLVVQLRPDVLVTDLRLPGLPGLDLIRESRSLSPRTRIVVVSMCHEAPYTDEAMRCGALGYVHKSHCGAHLIPAIRAALAARQYLSPAPPDPEP